MDLQIKNNREIYPQKIATKQGESQTTVLRFTRDSYKYDQIDLRNYKAYAVTSFNGEIDITEISKEVVGSQLVITWILSDRILRHSGAIAYQIVFKGDKNSPAVFNTYQGIIQNSESIDGDNHLSSNYPTIMKQWLDLINARSAVASGKIVYMLPNNSIPVEERVAGTIYFQWNESAYMTASAATGVVNLGSSPYADSGLHINGKHVYVDNTNDTVFVLEPSVWVETINNANCGVMASDISNGDEIKILLTASSAGTSGNAITYDLSLALYGAGKGQNNPSGGTTQGATLMGGYDEQIGVDNPLGQFEDHFGNILSNNQQYSVPDHSKTIEVCNSAYLINEVTYTAPKHGTFFLIPTHAFDGEIYVEITVNDVSFASYGYDDNSKATPTSTTCTIPLAKGDIINVKLFGGAVIHLAKFIPNKIVYGN